MPAGLVDHVVASLLQGLYDGDFAPGQKLTEADLTKRFGVARGSVREALRRLTAEGVVTFSTNQGARIQRLSRADAADKLAVIEHLTGFAAKLAAERFSNFGDKELLGETTSLLEQTKSSGRSLDFGRARDRFYRLLAQISGNRELMRLIPMIESHVIRVQFQAAYPPDATRKGMGDYKKILAAIAVGDASSAERRMRGHIKDIAKSIAGLPDHHFAPDKP